MGEESKYKVKCQHFEGCGDNDGLVKVSLRAQLVAVKVTLAASSTGGRGGWNGYHFAAAILDSLLCICNSSHMTSSRPNIRVRTRSPPLPLTSALREERPPCVLADDVHGKLAGVDHSPATVHAPFGVWWQR